MGREIEMSQTYMTKVNSDSNVNNEQYQYLKDRVRVLEGELE